MKIKIVLWSLATLLVNCSDTSMARMFNKKAASEESQPNRILDTLNIKAGSTIADIGAGGGYFSYRLAIKAGRTGKVYAVDVNKAYLNFISAEASKRNLLNVETVLADKDTLPLPEKSLDMVFLRNVYHHLPNRVEYLKNLKKYLKVNAAIVIIENLDNGFGFGALFGHNTKIRVIEKEMAQAHYSVLKRYDFLEKQSFTIFKAISGD